VNRIVDDHPSAQCSGVTGVAALLRDLPPVPFGVGISPLMVALGIEG